MPTANPTANARRWAGVHADATSKNPTTTTDLTEKLCRMELAAARELSRGQFVGDPYLGIPMMMSLFTARSSSSSFSTVGLDSPLS